MDWLICYECVGTFGLGWCWLVFDSRHELIVCFGWWWWFVDTLRAQSNHCCMHYRSVHWPNYHQGLGCGIGLVAVVDAWCHSMTSQNWCVRSMNMTIQARCSMEIEKRSYVWELKTNSLLGKLELKLRAIWCSLNGGLRGKLRLVRRKWNSGFLKFSLRLNFSFSKCLRLSC